jgi:hypothetical protein
MRLIRITDADGDGRFDGTINADVTIEKGSKISLESLALEIDDAKILVPPGSGAITYAQGGFTYSANVARTEPYTTGAGNELLDAITNGLNTAAIYYPENPVAQQAQTIGMEFRVAVNNTGKVATQAYKGNVGEISPSNWDATAGIAITTPAPPAQIYLGVDEPVVDGTCRASQIKLPSPSGNAYMEATIYKAVSGGDATNTERNGTWLCYTTQDLSLTTVEDLKAALETPAGRTLYCNFGVGATIIADDKIQATTILNGVVTNLGLPGVTAVTSGDITNPRIRLTRAGTQMIGSTWNIDEPVAVSNAIGAVPAGTKLWQFIVFWDSDTYIEVSQLQACIGPYATDTPASYIEETQADAGVGLGVAIKPIYNQPQGNNALYNKYQPNYALTDNVLTFPSAALATFLGYKSERNPVSGTRLSINFIVNAAYRYGPRLLSDSIIVLSETIPIVSYDSTRTNQDGDGQQRSILGVVPVSPANLGTVSYQGRQIFLDIHNNQPMTLRNLRFRLVDGEYLPFETIGQASMVILVKGPNE